MMLNSVYYMKYIQQMRQIIKILTILLLLLPFAFSVSTFSVAAKLNAIAYQPAQNIIAWNCSLCKQFTQIKTHFVFTHQGLQGYIAYQSEFEAILIAIRGSQNPFQVTNILNDDPEPYPYCDYCYVNSAIYRAWNTLRDNILVNLQKVISLFREAKLVSFVGHSLGGAMLTFAASQIATLYGNQLDFAFVTFGQPRVGNLQFSDYIQKIQKNYDVQIYRVIHYSDPIPHLPQLGFYIHSPKAEIWFDEQMNQFKECFFDRVGQCANSVANYSNEDHLIDGYMK